MTTPQDALQRIRDAQARGNAPDRYDLLLAGDLIYSSADKQEDLKDSVPHRTSLIRNNDNAPAYNPYFPFTSPQQDRLAEYEILPPSRWWQD